MGMTNSGACHTPLMSSVRDNLLAELDKVKGSMGSPSHRVYMNSIGVSIGQGTTAREVVKLLGDQIVSPVRWQQSMQQAIKDGCSEIYECGPSKQLKSIMKRLDHKMADKMKNVLV